MAGLSRMKFTFRTHFFAVRLKCALVFAVRFSALSKVIFDHSINDQILVHRF